MRKWIWTLIIGCALLFGGWFIVEQTLRDTASQQYEKTTIPTLFIHGYGSSYRAEEQMTKAIVKAGVTKNVIRANVAKDGNVKLSGVLPQNAYNPLVEVDFSDNKQTDQHKNGKYLKNVLVKLQKTYGFKKFNVVAHSMGNMAVAYYMLDNASDKSLPKLQKQVDLAGHYNGILGLNDEPKTYALQENGLPYDQTETYKELLALKEKYPKAQVQVLNIYGDLDDGSNSDGRVNNDSSKALAALLKERARSYQELEIKGEKGQHSKLHESAKVDRAIIDFIWKK
ncbi:alpha/beta hydrolase [Ligilactobacillus faecis]|uniref:Alpha/beta hydrolase n=1 Tax=Ligilactobacillus faecis TaxID=762833 RepID=A0ABV4DRV3_9LACO